MYEIIVQLYNKHCRFWMARRSRLYRKFQWNFTVYAIDAFGTRKNGRRFPDDICRCIFLKEIVWIAIEISLKFVAKVQINNIPALVRMMAWRRPCDKHLNQWCHDLLTHICVTRPQQVNFHTMTALIHGDRYNRYGTNTFTRMPTWKTCRFQVSLPC